MVQSVDVAEDEDDAFLGVFSDFEPFFEPPLEAAGFESPGFESAGLVSEVFVSVELLLPFFWYPSEYQPPPFNWKFDAEMRRCTLRRHFGHRSSGRS